MAWSRSLDILTRKTSSFVLLREESVQCNKVKKTVVFTQTSQQGVSYLLLNLRGAVDELVRPKFVLMILDKLDKGDEKTPGMRPVYNQSL